MGCVIGATDESLISEQKWMARLPIDGWAGGEGHVVLIVDGEEEVLLGFFCSIQVSTLGRCLVIDSSCGCRCIPIPGRAGVGVDVICGMWKKNVM